MILPFMVFKTNKIVLIAIDRSSKSLLILKRFFYRLFLPRNNKEFVKFAHLRKTNQRGINKTNLHDQYNFPGWRGPAI